MLAKHTFDLETINSRSDFFFLFLLKRVKCLWMVSINISPHSDIFFSIKYVNADRFENFSPVLRRSLSIVARVYKTTYMYVLNKNYVVLVKQPLLCVYIRLDARPLASGENKSFMFVLRIRFDSVMYHELLCCV